jgi:hypothetical protein
MVSGVSCLQLVTAVIEIVKKIWGKTMVLGGSCGREPDPVLAGVGQDYAELAEDQALLFGDDEELESAAETFAIADDGAQFGDVGRDGNGKLEGDDFSGLHLAAKGRSDAVEAEFAGASPISDGMAFAEDRDLDADIKTVSGVATQPLCWGFRGRLGTVSQSELQFEIFAKLCCGCGLIALIVLDAAGGAQRH